MLEARGLQVELGKRAVLHGIDLRIERGWTAVIGPNGAGKSTLLRALCGLLKPLSGEVLLHGKPIANMPARTRAQAVVWLSQQNDAASGARLSVREIVELGRLPYCGVMGALSAADHAAVDRALERADALGFASRAFDALSGGERQRVLLARALATESEVLCLDEPTAHLDPPHQTAIARLCREAAQSKLIVSVLHDVNLALRADRVALLHEGRLAALGAPDSRELHAALEVVFKGSLNLIEAQDGWHAALKI